MSSFAFNQLPGGLAIGYGVGNSIGPLIAPLLEDLRHEAWQSHQVRALDPQLAAHLVATGMMGEADGVTEASLSGVNSDRFGRMVAGARSGPGIDQLLDLSRRGAIDLDQLHRGYNQAGIRPEWFPILDQLRQRLLTTDELARMVIRAVITADEGRQRAADQGYSAAEFDAIVAATGNPPGPHELLDLWNRGVITESDVDRGLRQSDLKPEWYDAFKQLRFVMYTPSDLVRFMVREVFTPEIAGQYGLEEDFPTQAVALAQLIGLSPELIRQYWMAHWELPSTEQGYRMLHRGVITDSDMDVLLRAKDVMPFWRDKVKEIAYLVPGRVDLRRMYRAGVITRAEVLQGYKDLGYSADHAETLTRFADAEKAAGGTSARWLTRAKSRLYTVAHDEYMDGSIDGARARQLLAQVGASPDEADEILAVWSTEQEIARLELSPAQIKKAFRRGLYDRDVAIRELVERQMTAEDAATYLDSG